MRLFFTTLLSALLSLSAQAQVRTISGRLTSSEDGSPQPGVSILIKGTDIGTVSDVEGYYSISVPIGATLVFSFIGMQTREVVVTESNLMPVGSKGRSANSTPKRKAVTIKPIPRSLYQDTTVTDQVGVVSLTDKTPTYKNQGILDPTTIRSIQPRGNSYRIKSDTDPMRSTGFGLQFTTSLGIEHINRLPSLQNQFSQGRTNGSTLQWTGADQSEIFSWGPLTRTLEFDGSNYPFDKNGMLVPGGTGNGVLAKNYDPLSFFRTAFTNVNELMITVPAPRRGTLIFDLENRTRSGVIPNSEYQKTNLSTHLKNYMLADRLTAKASVHFNQSKGSLLQRGANLASIIGGVYRTPITFDNANGLSSTSARSSDESFQFSDGTKRSHAPGFSDNPYGLIQELPDREELHRFMATANLEYDPDSPFRLIFNGTVDQQWNTSIFGTPPGYSGYADGRLTHRKDDQTFAHAMLTSAYRHYFDDGELKLSLSYQTEHTARKLHRQDGFNFQSNDLFDDLNQADSMIAFKKDIHRTAHEMVVNAQYERAGWFTIRFANRNYFSNTIHHNQYTNFFPSGSLSIDLVHLLDLWSINALKLYGTASRTLREAPLLYSNWSYGSTALPVENYAGFYESAELFTNKSVAPETEQKFETGLKLDARRFNLEIAYFNNLTRDFILPLTSPGGTELTNVVDIKNFGGIVSAGYSSHLRNGRWGTDIRWSKYNSVVTEIHSPDQWIAIAGFQSTQTVLTKGQPVGAIFGTTYARNAEGNRIIDSDGFPIKDSNIKRIGNPIPDWVLSWSSFIQWKQWKFSFLLDYKRGGEIWNGTNSVLDYLGRSSNTANLRNTANYIFEGVDINGNPNLIPVSFYDPTKPISENRWVRYGWEGVAEDYVEDASWVRLNEVVISYSTKHQRKALIKSLTFSIIGRNLLLFTPYSGVDPSGSLFGYTSGNGLDLFNMPATSGYSAQINFKL